MHVTEVQLKMIAIGLVPVFITLAVMLPKTVGTTILLGAVVFVAFVVSYIGMRMEKKAATEEDDLLTLPPKRS